MVHFPIEPTRTALLLVDLQRVFVEGSPVAAPDGPAVAERLGRLAGVCRDHQITVIHTVHVVRADGSNTGILSEILPPVADGMIDEENPLAEPHPLADIHPGDILIRKPRFGAFYGTDLDLILRAAQIDTLLIGGIATHACCDTTAREAAARDFKVLFLSDGTACFTLPGTGTGPVDADDLQRAVLAVMAFGFAEVLSVDGAVRRIQARPI
ncbi:cysteine hydrolase family protein [Actinopolymorpha pittospori]|uniref:Ureidoacrylate peracid hydrolase n=1 Tax=Actinopolymorpha pittospori TaxID=648752 RepID=A0A927RBA1_9ACTN|nr:isochorismatase family cysteine hydrolase [Actinopolymorpha pittospori]MBE1605865.1 ureidoacrylate peracid hydrolase [Actinopolymorpha pittospori]